MFAHCPHAFSHMSKQEFYPSISFSSSKTPLFRILLTPWYCREQPLQSPRHTTPDGNIIYPRDYDYSFNKTADYLILAGDLTVVKSKTDRDEFIQWLIRVCNMGYKRVFWILGDTDFDDSRNHEIVVKIYVRNFTLLRAIEAANITNLTFLENERFDLTEGSRSISILGTVLWSAYDYVAMAGLAPKKPDRPGHTDYDHDEQHWIARKYLNDEITKIKANATTKNNPILVITHHPPTRRGVADPNPKIAAKDQKNSWKDGTDILSGPANPSAQDATLRQPFVCNQTRDPRNAPGKRQGGLDPGIALLGAGDVWVYGHTHYNNPNLVARDGVVLKCNQRGDHADSSKAYKNRPLDGRVETPAWSFDPGLTFKI